MEFERPSDMSPDIKSSIAVEVPAVESLLNPTQIKEMWPTEIATNEAVLEQVEKRRRLKASLDEFTEHVSQPTTTIEEAISQGKITEVQAINLFDSMSDLLDDQEYRRLVLYLPFEFLPNKSWHPGEAGLQESTERFRGTYLKAWESLLVTQDARANFVDGDVIEVEQREAAGVPRVVKAAHLIPKLVQCGMLETDSVIDMLKKSSDPILWDSIADTFPVLIDMGFVTEKDIDELKSSTDPKTRDLADEIAEILVEKQADEDASISISYSSVQSELDKSMAEINSGEYGGITSKRKAWLLETKTQEAVESIAEQVRDSIVAGSFSNATVKEFLSPDATEQAKQVLVEGIRKAVEFLAQGDLQQAQSIYINFQEALHALKDSEDPQTNQLLLKTFRRLHYAGVLTTDQLAEMGIILPKLEGPFSENTKLMDAEIKETQNLLRSVMTNPELSSLVYPIALAYGSRLKGYGEKESDVDTAIFVRPGVQETDRVKLATLLPEMMEFWLEQNGDELKIHDFPEATGLFGESYWVHLLFGSSWIGSKDAIREMREKLLVPYMREEDHQIHGLDSRRVYIEELEKDALQYRLMHKGYERFYPATGGIDTTHADRIDGESMFWDSGYRRIATKLYASQVFLPRLK